MANTNPISPDAFSNHVLTRNGKMGQNACEVMSAAIQAVDPYQCVRNSIRLSGKKIFIAGQEIRQTDFDRISLLGFGKAAVPMAKAIVDILGDLLSLAVVITKDLQFKSAQGYQGKLDVLIGGHPVPNTESVESTQSILDQLPAFTERDLILVVISGGGSALFTSPMPGIALEDMQHLTGLLLKSGADIQEINTLRKHLDQVKGGRLAARLSPARVHALILSDVIGDRLDMIASGPTVPDPTTFEDAWKVITNYHLEDRLTDSIRRYLQEGMHGAHPETLKLARYDHLQINNHLVGTNVKAALAARMKAEELNYNSLVITTHLTGLTPKVAHFLSGIIKTEIESDLPAQRPICLIFGGETTVEVKGHGRGGRNQDLVLHMVRELSGHQNVIFISLATDGEDGPTDAAGAASDAFVYRDGSSKMGMNIDTYIATNNSYEYFKQVGGLIRTGATGTNVNDLMFIFAESPENGYS